MATSSNSFTKTSSRDDTSDPMLTYLQKRSAATGNSGKLAAAVSTKDESKILQKRSPSPPASKPSSSMTSWARMLDVCAQMEFAYVKYCVISKKAEAIQNKIKVLNSQPVGDAAYTTDLKALEEVTGLYDEVGTSA